MYDTDKNSGPDCLPGPLFFGGLPFMIEEKEPAGRYAKEVLQP